MTFAQRERSIRFYNEFIRIFTTVGLKGEVVKARAENSQSWSINQ